MPARTQPLPLNLSDAAKSLCGLCGGKGRNESTAKIVVNEKACSDTITVLFLSLSSARVKWSAVKSLCVSKIKGDELQLCENQYFITSRV